MWKKIGIGVVVLLLIIAGVAWYLLSNLDSIVKAAIEKYGSAATQAAVSVDSVKISLTSGEGSLLGVKIGNPTGYTTPDAMLLGSITVKLDTTSVTGGGPIVIKEITIDQPQVTYEAGGAAGSNLQAIQKNATAYAQQMSGGSAAGGQAPAQPAASGGGSERKVIINDLYIKDGKVGVSATVLQGKTLTVPMPNIHLTNIGKSSNGATPAQVADQVLGAISDAATKAGASALTQQLNAVVSGAMQKGSAGASDLGGQIKGLFGK